MSPPVSTTALHEQQAVLSAQVISIQQELTEHKLLTRKEISELKVDMKSIWQALTGVERRIAGWGVASGVITALVLKVIDHLWK